MPRLAERLVRSAGDRVLRFPDLGRDARGEQTARSFWARTGNVDRLCGRCGGSDRAACRPRPAGCLSQLSTVASAAMPAATTMPGEAAMATFAAMPGES